MTDLNEETLAEAFSKTAAAVKGPVSIMPTRVVEGSAWSQRQFSPANPSGITPTEFKVLILPDKVEEVTKGGIIRPVESVDRENYAAIEGRIIAISHLAFGYADEAEWAGNKPKPGDRVLYAKYAGIRHKGADGVEYVLVNDKDVVAILS